MKALSVRQPYASLLVLGLKEFETRSRRTSFRGRFAVHAAAHQPVKVGEAALFGPYPVWRKEHGLFGYFGPTFGAVRLLTGMVIGTAVLDDVADTAHADKFTDVERALGDYTAGRTAWHVTDPRPVKPVPAAGKLTWWDLDDDLVDELPEPKPEPAGWHTQATPVYADAPDPAPVVQAVRDRHDTEHQGPIQTCTDPLCDTAVRWIP